VYVREEGGAMRAIVSHGYGELALEDIDRPELGPEHVLVRVRAAAVNPLDYHELSGTPRFARPMMGYGGRSRRGAGSTPRESSSRSGPR